MHVADIRYKNAKRQGIINVTKQLIKQNILSATLF